MDKNEIRRETAGLVMMLDDETRRARDDRIRQEVIETINWPNIKHLCSYRAQAKFFEIDTAPIMDFIHESYPHVEIDFVEASREARIPTKDYDLILVPLVAFDGAGNRLGRGAGWYDRFLAGQPNATKIGLAYLEQHVPGIPVEPHDIGLDHIFNA